jgi:glycolate oxidase FAD binding subunit
VDSPLRQFYGTARDFLIGAEFVDGKGNQCKSGGRVVKNVTGYDLHKLLIGSLGTLGIITRLNFRTFPAPESSRGFVASFTDAEGALALRRAIAESPLTPLTLDVVSPGLARIFAERTPSAPEVLVFAGEARASNSTALPPIGNWFRAKEWQLCAAFAGTPDVLQRYERDLTRFAEIAHATSTAVLDDATRPSVWGRLRETLAMLRDTSPATAIFKVTLLPLQHAKAFVELQEIADRAAVTPAFVARANGTIYFALVPGEPKAALLEKFYLAMHETFSLAQRFNGGATLLFAPIALKKHAGIWSAKPPGFALLKRVKCAFDPHNIFGPGRLGEDI